MANNFASVEWLSQSSSKKKQTMSPPCSPEKPSYGKTTTNDPRSPIMQSNIDHVASYQEMQQQTWSQSLWDSYFSSHSSDLSNHSSDYEDSATLEESTLSPILPCMDLPQRNQDASEKSLSNGLYNKSENILFDDSQKPTNSQDTTTCNQEMSGKQAEQKNFNEDLTHSVVCTFNGESGYESETSQSGSTTPGAERTEESSDASDEEGKLSRRLRTAFTTEQITTLENTFQKHKYLGASERRKLAGKLQLSEVQIKTWFQNRRMKHKREVQEGRQGHFPAPHLYGVYGYPAPSLPAYPYAQPMQQLYAPKPLLDPMSINYGSQAPTLEPLTAFSHPSMPMIYMPHQSVLPPSYQYEEQQYGRY